MLQLMFEALQHCCERHGCQRILTIIIDVLTHQAAPKRRTLHSWPDGHTPKPRWPSGHTPKPPGGACHFMRPRRLANLGREMDVRPSECHHDASIRRARKPVRGSVWTSAVVNPIVPLSCRA